MHVNGRKRMSTTQESRQDGQGQHKTFTIIVNARRKTVTADELTFEQIVALAFDPVPANAFFTVTYSGGVHHRDGSLLPGQTVEIKDGMQFHVTETGQS
jgi:hypothetical protein